MPWKDEEVVEEQETPTYCYKIIYTIDGRTEMLYGIITRETTDFYHFQTNRRTVIINKKNVQKLATTNRIYQSLDSSSDQS